MWMKTSRRLWENEVVLDLVTRSVEDRRASKERRRAISISRSSSNPTEEVLHPTMEIPPIYPTVRLPPSTTINPLKSTTAINLLFDLR